MGNFSIYLPDPLEARLRDVAEKADRSVSRMVTDVLSAVLVAAEGE